MKMPPIPIGGIFKSWQNRIFSLTTWSGSY